jgi:SAM-dependent methyltransferase
LNETARERLTWEDVLVCNFCGGARRSPYLKSRVPHWYEGRPLRLVACRSCGLVFAAPRPVARQGHESSRNGGDGGREAYERKLLRPNVAKVHRRHVERALAQLGRPARSLFDMGCGAGTVLHAARALGLEASGNDINHYAIERLREAGFPAVHGFTSELQLTGQYDIVTNFDYLEHTHTPFDDLKTCFELLAPDGILYLKTLYLGSADHRRDGEGWKLFGPGHFHFFFPEVLLAMIREAGFMVEHVETPQLIFVLARKAAPAGRFGARRCNNGAM